LSMMAYVCSYYNEDFMNLSEKVWQHLATMYPGKNEEQLKLRWQNVLKVPLNKTPWTKKEDDMLEDLVNTKGAAHWREIALELHSQSGSVMFRQSKQCRERWTNHLDPSLKKGAWTNKEDVILLKEFLTKGKKWSEIAKLLPGRTENSVKNRWVSLMKKYKTEMTLEAAKMSEELKDEDMLNAQITRTLIDIKERDLSAASSEQIETETIFTVDRLKSAESGETERLLNSNLKHQEYGKNNKFLAEKIQDTFIKQLRESSGEPFIPKPTNSGAQDSFKELIEWQKSQDSQQDQQMKSQLPVFQQNIPLQTQTQQQQPSQSFQQQQFPQQQQQNQFFSGGQNMPMYSDKQQFMPNNGMMDQSQNMFMQGQIQNQNQTTIQIQNPMQNSNQVQMPNNNQVPMQNQMQIPMQNSMQNSMQNQTMNQPFQNPNQQYQGQNQQFQSNQQFQPNQLFQQNSQSQNQNMQNANGYQMPQMTSYPIQYNNMQPQNYPYNQNNVPFNQQGNFMNNNAPWSMQTYNPNFNMNQPQFQQPYQNQQFPIQQPQMFQQSQPFQQNLQFQQPQPMFQQQNQFPQPQQGIFQGQSQQFMGQNQPFQGQNQQFQGQNQPLFQNQYQSQTQSQPQPFSQGNNMQSMQGQQTSLQNGTNPGNSNPNYCMAMVDINKNEIFFMNQMNQNNGDKNPGMVNNQNIQQPNSMIGGGGYGTQDNFFQKPEDKKYGGIFDS